ncbi:UNVERIFIED_CONTAM: hypothetical protein GTU68_033560 [Idotea baltica]|nr:hypothetical protein [Idotea baltica]
MWIRMRKRLNAHVRSAGCRLNLSRPILTIPGAALPLMIWKI